MRLLQTQSNECEWEGGVRPLTVATIVFALAEVAASVREYPNNPDCPIVQLSCEYHRLNRFCWAKPYLFRAVALPVRCAAIWPTAAQCRAEIMQNGKNGMQTWHKSIENLYVPPKWTVSVCQRRQRQGNIVRSHFAWHSKRHFGVFISFAQFWLLKLQDKLLFTQFKSRSYYDCRKLVELHK